MSSLISVSNLSVRYGQTEVLKNISFEIKKGDFVGLVGPNGGGKTTLVKTILGLIPIHSGKVSLLGKKEGEFIDFKKIGYLPQKQTGINPLFPASVEEVVILGLLSSKTTPKRISEEDIDKVQKILGITGISNIRHKMLSDLSGGQQQKVMLARALVSSPQILVLDEPSTALDPGSREAFFSLLKELNDKTGVTIILITHDTGYVGEYANKILYIDRSLMFFGKLEEFCPSGEIASCFEKSDHHIIWHQHI